MGRAASRINSGEPETVSQPEIERNSTGSKGGISLISVNGDIGFQEVAGEARQASKVRQHRARLKSIREGLSETKPPETGRARETEEGQLAPPPVDKQTNSRSKVASDLASGKDYADESNLDDWSRLSVGESSTNCNKLYSLSHSVTTIGKKRQQRTSDGSIDSAYTILLQPSGTQNARPHSHQHAVNYEPKFRQAQKLGIADQRQKVTNNRQQVTRSSEPALTQTTKADDGSFTTLIKNTGTAAANGDCSICCSLLSSLSSSSSSSLSSSSTIPAQNAPAVSCRHKCGPPTSESSSSSSTRFTCNCGDTIAAQVIDWRDSELVTLPESCRLVNGQQSLQQRQQQQQQYVTGRNEPPLVGCCSVHYMPPTCDNSLIQTHCTSRRQAVKGRAPRLNTRNHEQLLGSRRRQSAIANQSDQLDTIGSTLVVGQARNFPSHLGSSLAIPQANLPAEHRQQHQQQANDSKLDTTDQTSHEHSHSPTTESDQSSTQKVDTKREESLFSSTEEHLKQPEELEKEQPPNKQGSSGDNNNHHQAREDCLTHMDWKDIARRYGKLPCQAHGQFWRRVGLCNMLVSTITNLFPILTSFKHYSLPGDLMADLLAGFTVAVLHIPQGMAYGLLAGVDPINGLYVSFVPVIIMALMSKSRHVSYGTFAIVSMLLANATDSVRRQIGQQLQHANQDTALVGAALVVTNNHQAADNHGQLQVLRNCRTGNCGQIVANEDVDVKEPTVMDDQWLSSYNTSTLHWPGTNAQDFVMPTNIEILAGICLFVGLIQILMSLLRLGFLSVMFSDQLVSSFTAASAVHVVSSQLGGVFDLTLPPIPEEGIFRVCRIWWVFGTELLKGEFNQVTALISMFILIYLLVIKEIIEPAIRRRHKSLTCLPSELVLMVVLILSSWYWDFQKNFNIRIVGNIPTGLPEPRAPRLDLAPYLVQDSITVAIVSFAMNLSLAQVYAKRFRYKMNPNHELFALGVTNTVSSFFSCFPCASSLSRSAVQSNLKAKSPLCSLFSCIIVVSIICYFAPILYDLPRCALSCIIIVALKSVLMQVKDFFETWRLSKLDALTWLITFVSVLAVGVTYGLVLGIVASLFMVFFRILNPKHSILGQLPGTELYVDKDAFMDCCEIEQVKIFRFNSVLCYLNRETFKACVERSLPDIYQHKGFNLFNKESAYSARENCAKKIKFLIIDCSALAYCDYSGAETLVDIIEDMEDHKISVYLAACPLKLIDMIERMHRTKVIENNVFPSIADAVSQSKYLNGSESMSNNTVDTKVCLHSVKSMP